MTAAPSQHQPYPLPSPPVILLVEDYPANVLVAETIILSLGYRCEVARNGFEALEMVERNQYALILMDLEMHDMDGFETLRRIREKEEETGRVPVKVIAMTCHALAGDRERCLQSMNDYMAKPFTVSQLGAMLSFYLHKETDGQICNWQAAPDPGTRFACPSGEVVDFRNES